MTNDARVEHDPMGDVIIDAGALWGPATQRAIDNFPISAIHLDSDLIKALAEIKHAATAGVSRFLAIESCIPGSAPRASRTARRCVVRRQAARLDLWRP
jgi:fumarate hydratase, class II